MKKKKKLIKQNDRIVLSIGGDPHFVVTYLTDPEYRESSAEFLITRPQHYDIEECLTNPWYDDLNDAWDSKNETYLRGYVKWDGCCNFWFGNKDGYHHFCGAREIQQMRGLLKKLYSLASEIMGRELDEPWDTKDFEYEHHN
jgi:hypothetical protein